MNRPILFYVSGHGYGHARRMTQVIRRLHDGTWGVIFGNGLNSTAGTAGLFIVHIATDGTQTVQYIDTKMVGPQVTVNKKQVNSLNGITQVTPVDLDGEDDVFNWPMMYAVEVGHWKLGDVEVAQLRDYLLRGGFLMVDDFHGDAPYHDVFSEWQQFLLSMNKVFPERPIEDIPDGDAIFHTLFDLQDRFQVPGSANIWETGLTYEAGETGKVPHWRCIRDDKGRVMVAICHNMDLGDAWEHANETEYPEKFSGLAFRIVLNYINYSMTH